MAWLFFSIHFSYMTSLLQKNVHTQGTGRWGKKQKLQEDVYFTSKWGTVCTFCSFSITLSVKRKHTLAGNATKQVTGYILSVVLCEGGGWRWKTMPKCHKETNSVLNKVVHNFILTCCIKIKSSWMNTYEKIYFFVYKSVWHAYYFPVKLKQLFLQGENVPQSP